MVELRAKNHLAVNYSSIFVGGTMMFGCKWRNRRIKSNNSAFGRLSLNYIHVLTPEIGIDVENIVSDRTPNMTGTLFEGQKP